MENHTEKIDEDIIIGQNIFEIGNIIRIQAFAPIENLVALTKGILLDKTFQKFFKEFLRNDFQSSGNNESYLG